MPGGNQADPRASVGARRHKFYAQGQKRMGESSLCRGSKAGGSSGLDTLHCDDADVSLLGERAGIDLGKRTRRPQQPRRGQVHLVGGRPT